MEDKQKKILFAAAIVLLILNLSVFGWLLSDLLTDADDLPETEGPTVEKTEDEGTTEEPETEEPTTEELTTEEPTTEEQTTEEPTTEEPTTEEPTTEEPTTEAVVIEPGNIHLEETVTATDELVQVLPVDQTLLVDLDGDGIQEKVTIRENEDHKGYGQRRFHFQINELYYYDSGYGEILPGGSLTLAGVPFYLVDLDVTDSYREIAIRKDVMGEATYFFRYQNGVLIPIGTAEGIPGLELNGMGELKVNGDGTLNAMVRYDVLQPSFITKTWKLMNAHLHHASLDEVIPEYYEFELRSAEAKMILKQDMTFYAERGGSSDNLVTLPAGTAVDIARFYPEGEWIQILYEQDTKAVWLRRVGNSLVLPMNIFGYNISDYFGGLGLAG